jgi:hypothetical protein
MYISANIAVARTKNARQSDGYVGEYVVFPAIMAQIMESISEATHAGKGECVYHLNPYYFHEYTAKAMAIGRALMEDKMVALGYRIVQESENLYKFVWLSE